MPAPDSGSLEPIFQHFSSLPQELREMIWSYALPQRLITIYHSIIAFHGRRKITALRLRSTPVAVLQACHEARAVGLKTYVKICPTFYSNENKQAYIHIDFSRDTLFFLFSHSELPLQTALFFLDTHKIRSLAIDTRFPTPHSLHDRLTHLQELVFVAPPPALELKPMGKMSLVLKDIDAEHEKEVMQSSLETFSDVFNTVAERFFSENALVFGRSLWVSLAVCDRIQCDGIKLWDFGYSGGVGL